MTEQEYIEWLKSENGYSIVVPTGEGKWIGIQRLMFHWTMHEGKIGDMCGHDRRFCYQTFDLASEALNDWMIRGFSGEPNGWHRDPYTGRRRPDGDPTREYVAV